MTSIRAWKVWGSVLALATAGCSSAPEPFDAPECTTWSVSNEVAWTEQYLGMTLAQQSAVVSLSGTVEGELSYCSGTLVVPEMLLTAAHCLSLVEADDALVRAGDAAATVEAAIRHDELDVMLLVLHWSAAAPTVDQQLTVLGGDLDEQWLGQRAVAAGFGRTLSSLAGSRHFSVQTITALDENLIEVTPVGGLGEFGVCGGDSGGPLLIRSGEDGVVIAGVLSTASANCRGVGYYTRVDVLGEWLKAEGIEVDGDRATSAPKSADAAPCEDRCDGDIAMRCVDGAVAEADCGACDATCIIALGSAQAGCF